MIDDKRQRHKGSRVKSCCPSTCSHATETVQLPTVHCVHTREYTAYCLCYARVHLPPPALGKGGGYVVGWRAEIRSSSREQSREGNEQSREGNEQSREGNEQSREGNEQSREGNDIITACKQRQNTHLNFK